LDAQVLECFIHESWQFVHVELSTSVSVVLLEQKLNGLLELLI